MASYKDPGFEERVALAKHARQKALDQLRAKPPVDEAVLAERQAARLVREEAEAAARIAKLAAREKAKADKRAQAAEADAAAMRQIGRASCRERVWPYVSIRVVAVSFKNNKKKTNTNTS